MPEPPDRDDWEQKREEFAAQLIEMLDEPDQLVFLVMKRDLKGIQGHD